MKYHVNNSSAFKGFNPVNPDEKRAGFGSARETFSLGRDYTDPEQHSIKVAPPGTVSLNQWPDEDFPEFRRDIYAYCMNNVMKSQWKDADELDQSLKSMPSQRS